jgi:hypothetical protein
VGSIPTAFAKLGDDIINHSHKYGKWYMICAHCGLRKKYAAKVIATAYAMEHNRDKHSNQQIAFVEQSVS